MMSHAVRQSDRSSSSGSLNIIASIDQLAAKLGVLDQRCAEVGRDRATLETSTLLTVVIDGVESHDMPEATGGRVVTGSAQQVAEEIKRRVFGVGVDGVSINLPTHRHTPGVITRVGEALRSVM